MLLLLSSPSPLRKRLTLRPYVKPNGAFYCVAARSTRSHVENPPGIPQESHSADTWLVGLCPSPSPPSSLLGPCLTRFLELILRLPPAHPPRVGVCGVVLLVKSLFYRPIGMFCFFYADEGGGEVCLINKEEKDEGEENKSRKRIRKNRKSRLIKSLFFCLISSCSVFLLFCFLSVLVVGNLNR